MKVHFKILIMAQVSMFLPGQGIPHPQSLFSTTIPAASGRSIMFFKKLLVTVCVAGGENPEVTLVHPRNKLKLYGFTTDS